MKEINGPVITKIDSEAIVPTKRKEDAGYDIYGIFERDIIEHRPGQILIIGTGFKMMFPPTHVALLRERGSTGVINLQLRAGVIEGNFQGEYKIILSNGNSLEDILYVKPETTEKEIIKYYRENNNLEGLGELQIMKDGFNRNVLVYTNKTGEEMVLAYIYPQDKAIAQLIFTRKEDWEIKEIKEEKFTTFHSERGEGMLGSSGK